MAKIDIAIDKAKKEFGRALSKRQKATGKEFERLHEILIKKEEAVHRLVSRRKKRLTVEAVKPLLKKKVRSRKHRSLRPSRK